MPVAHLAHLDWPFFEPRHRDFARRLESWAASALAGRAPQDTDAACRDLARRLGEGGWLAHAIPEAGAAIDVRTLCLAREILARHDGLADFAFAMQGLGSGPILLAGGEAVRARILPGVRSGAHLAAFALSEAEAGSDVAAISCAALRVEGGWRIDGEKTWISNGGIAGHYVVVARTGEAPGARGLSAFVVEADNPGLSIARRIEVVAPHPLATLRFENCFVGDEAVLGRPGEGFKVAMATLDIFRPTVGAAALGFARHALEAMATRARSRRMFGATLGDLQMTQARIAEVALAVDASALLVYRAAWQADTSGGRTTREAAMAKLFATEAAQQAADAAVQLWGGLGVEAGSVPEMLYREVRALRIYEGASEVQKLIIARAVLG
ncbi:MAG: acyl-CoA dehydrogenase family protein [Rhodospirillales bacterium]|nr:acyl-CoA dehydrogenase family protein [Rhodospirillales bacterium]